ARPLRFAPPPRSALALRSAPAFGSAPLLRSKLRRFRRRQGPSLLRRRSTWERRHPCRRQVVALNSPARMPALPGWGRFLEAPPHLGGYLREQPAREPRIVPAIARPLSRFAVVSLGLWPDTRR